MDTEAYRGMPTTEAELNICCPKEIKTSEGIVVTRKRMVAIGNYLKEIQLGKCHLYPIRPGKLVKSWKNAFMQIRRGDSGSHLQPSKQLQHLWPVQTDTATDVPGTEETVNGLSIPPPVQPVYLLQTTEVC